MNRLQAEYPLLAALGLLWVTVIGVIAVASRHLGSHVGYALDDAYIQLSIARNLADHGIWGVTPYAFTAASSSIVWPLLLAPLRWVGLFGEAAPLLLNVLFASLAVGLAAHVLAHFRIGPGWTLLTLLAAIFLAPLPALIFCGLEHSLQLLVTLAFVFVAARAIEAERSSEAARALELWLPGLAALATGVRFEGLFLVAVVGALLVCRGRRGVAALVALAGLGPIVLFGLYAISKGGTFLPNTLMLKGSFPLGSPLALLKFLVGINDAALLPGGDRANIPMYYVGLSGIVVHAHHLWALLVACIFAALFGWRRTRRVWNAPTSMLLIISFAVLLHAQFAKLGWFYRYEAYLMFAGIVAIPVALRDVLPARIELALSVDRIPLYAAAVLLAALLLSPVVARAAHALVDIPAAERNIYDQQYQMGRFCRAYYGGAGVAANDIGAVTFLADVHLLDLVGLANVDIARAKRKRALTSTLIESLAAEEDVRIAMVFDGWFLPEKLLPPGWTRVGELSLTEPPVVSPQAAVSFYASTPQDVEPLQRHMRDFGRSLPITATMTVF